MDFSKGKIYKLTCETGKVYIGSTIKKLKQRLSEHNHSTNPCMSKTFINPTIELLLDYPCKSKKELLEKEQEFIEKFDCVNICRAFRSKEYTKKYHYEKNKEWRKENPELRQAQQERYREKHREEINSKRRVNITCECGCSINKYTLKRHQQSKKHKDLMNSRTNHN